MGPALAIVAEMLVGAGVIVSVRTSEIVVRITCLSVSMAAAAAVQEAPALWGQGVVPCALWLRMERKTSASRGRMAWPGTPGPVVPAAAIQQDKSLAACGSPARVVRVTRELMVAAVAAAAQVVV